MWADPIVEEIHAARTKLLAGSDGNLRKAIDSALRRQKVGGRAVLKAAPRAPAPPTLPTPLQRKRAMV